MADTLQAQPGIKITQPEGPYVSGRPLPNPTPVNVLATYVGDTVHRPGMRYPLLRKGQRVRVMRVSQRLDLSVVPTPPVIGTSATVRYQPFEHDECEVGPGVDIHDVPVEDLRLF